MAILVLVAHVGHWLWVLYLPPLLIVAGSILRTRISERRKKRGTDLEDLGEPALERGGDLVSHGALGKPLDQGLEKALDD